MGIADQSLVQLIARLLGRGAARIGKILWLRETTVLNYTGKIHSAIRKARNTILVFPKRCLFLQKLNAEKERDPGNTRQEMSAFEPEGVLIEEGMRLLNFNHLNIILTHIQESAEEGQPFQPMLWRKERFPEEERRVILGSSNGGGLQC